jgi:hypothetical protein
MCKVLTGLLLAAMALGCGGDDDDDDTATADAAADAAASVDSAPGPDAVDDSCAIQTALGDLGELPATPAVLATGMNILYRAELNTDVDKVALELYSGTATFGGGDPQPGTYPLTGDELQFQTCGVCVLLYANDMAGPGFPDPDKAYMATGGTVVLDTVGATLAGSLSNVTFQEVTIDPGTAVSTPVPGGCNAALDSATFDVTVD